MRTQRLTFQRCPSTVDSGHRQEYNVFRSPCLAVRVVECSDQCRSRGVWPLCIPNALLVVSLIPLESLPTVVEFWLLPVVAVHCTSQFRLRLFWLLLQVPVLTFFSLSFRVFFLFFSSFSSLLHFFVAVGLEKN